MSRHEMAELARFNALCREHGVTYGQGVAMGLKLPEQEKGALRPGKTTPGHGKWRAGSLDCCKFAELYNLGCNNQEIADGLRMNVNAVHKRMKMLGLPGNRTQGGKKVRNPEVTPEQLYDRAEAVGMPAVLTEA